MATQEVMTDDQLAYADYVTAEKAAGRKPKPKSRMARYARPWNNNTPATDAVHVPDNTAGVERVARLAPRFIDVRPRADRYVFVLLRDLRRLDESAGDAGRTWYDENREKLTVDQGSDWITRLKAKIGTYNGQPVMSVNHGPAEPVPATDDWARWRQLAAELVTYGGRWGARFAVDTEPGARNTIAFWWISPNRNGTRYRLRQVIGGSGPVDVRMNPKAMIAIAEKIIAAGPEAAMIRYGREMGECGHCGRSLTNDESRDLGIGPRCRNKG